VYSHYYW